MTALSMLSDRASNPLDSMEQIAAANDWAFDRRNTDEMAAESNTRRSSDCTGWTHPVAPAFAHRRCLLVPARTLFAFFTSHLVSGSHDSD